MDGTQEISVNRQISQDQLEKKLKKELPAIIVPDYVVMRDIPGKPFNGGEFGIIYLEIGENGLKKIRKYWFDYGDVINFTLVEANLCEIDALVRAKSQGFLPAPYNLVVNESGKIMGIDEEYIEGPTLADYFQYCGLRGGMTLRKAGQAIDDIVALERLLGRTGVDTKPTNFIIETKTNRVRMVDFAGASTDNLDDAIGKDITDVLAVFLHRSDFEGISKLFTTAAAGRTFLRVILNKYIPEQQRKNAYDFVVESCSLVDKYGNDKPLRDQDGYYPPEVIKEAEEYIQSYKGSTSIE